MIRVRFWLLAAGCWLLAGCGNNPLEVDVSDILVEEAKIQRFDRDFFSLTADNVSAHVPEMQKKYPGFTDLFVKNIVCPSGINDSACIPAIIKFVSDKDMRGAYEEVQKVFPDMFETESRFTDVLRHHKYYFPEKKLPQIVAMMSGFNYAIESSTPAIGLEMYLGSKSKFYEMMQIPGYKRTMMRKEFIVPDLVRAWMMKEFPNANKSGTLLNEMIYQGKLLYLADALMPDTDDTLKIGYSKQQLNWCAEHEKDMWGFLIKNKFLYSNETEVVAKYTGDAPFTTGFVKESPPRTGIWLGWKIVRKYMRENSETTLEQLMKENDAQLILSKSKYRPE